MTGDHDRDFLEELEELLSVAGFEARVFRDVDSVRRWSAELKPDALLVDLRMPWESGFELTSGPSQSAEAAKTRGAADFDAEQQHERPTGEIGLCACLKKPFDAEELIAVLGKLSAGGRMVLRSRDGPRPGRVPSEHHRKKTK